MSYPAALWFICLLESQIFQFLCPVVQTGSQQWSLELGMLPGEYEPGQVKLQSEEFLRKAAKDGWNWVKFSECWFQVQLENYISSLPCFPIYWKLLTKRQSGGQISKLWKTGRIQKNRAWKILFPLDERKILNLRVWEEGGEMLDPCCEQAILEEEGACPGVRMTCGGSERTRRSCRGALELAAGSLSAAQLLVVSSWFCVWALPTAGARKETRPWGHLQLQEELAWFLAGK